MFKIFNPFKKEEILDYPSDFGFIEFSPIGLQSGIRDNKNKIILRYFINKFGNMKLKKYRYSEERVFALEKIHKVPIFDKTKKDFKIPIYARISPGEVKYTQIV